jgi:hypothetical protein
MIRLTMDFTDHGQLEKFLADTKDLRPVVPTLTRGDEGPGQQEDPDAMTAGELVEVANIIHGRHRFVTPEACAREVIRAVNRLRAAASRPSAPEPSEAALAWRHFNDRVRNKAEGQYGPFTDADWLAACALWRRAFPADALALSVGSLRTVATAIDTAEMSRAVRAALAPSQPEAAR